MLKTKLRTFVFLVAIKLVLSQKNFHMGIRDIHSQLSRLSTAWGSSKSLVTVSPTKVKACKSILFTEDVPEVEIKNTCLMKLTHFLIT